MNSWEQFHVAVGATSDDFLPFIRGDIAGITMDHNIRSGVVLVLSVKAWIVVLDIHTFIDQPSCFRVYASKSARSSGCTNGDMYSECQLDCAKRLGCDRGYAS
jgi:hypothetical protein